MSSGSLSQRFNKSVIVSETRKALVVRNSASIGTQNTDSPSTFQVDLPQSGWVVLSEGKLTMDLNVTQAGAGTAALKNGASSILNTGRFICGGVPFEDISNLHVLARGIHDLTSDNDSSTRGGWAYGYDSNSNLDASFGKLATVRGGGTTGTGFHNVSLDLPMGILKTDIPIPLFALPPCSLEFGMNQTKEACFLSNYAAGDKANVKNVRYHAAIYETTREHNEDAMRKINSEEGLSIPVTTWSSTTFTTDTGTEQEALISSSARSAKAVLLMQRKAANINEEAVEYQFVRDNLSTLHLQVGSSIYPNSPMDVRSDAYLEVQKAMGHSIGESLVKSDITKVEYFGADADNDTTSTKAYYGFNLEKIVNDSQIIGSDLGSSPLRLKMKYQAAPTASNQFYAYVQRDGNLVIKANGDVKMVV